MAKTIKTHSWGRKLPPGLANGASSAQGGDIQCLSQHLSLESHPKTSANTSSNSSLEPEHAARKSHTDNTQCFCQHELAQEC